MKAKSIKGKSVEEIQTALQQSISDDYRPTLAIVFISIKQDRKAICEILHQHEIDVIGATSCTKFIDGHQDEGSIVILLLDLNKAYYTILFQEVGHVTVSDAATQMAQEALQHFSNPAFIICSTGLSTAGKMMDGETLIRSIENVVGVHVNMFGGMAGDDMTFTGTYAFTYNQSTDYGMAALILNEDKIGLHGMAISGWKPIGVTRTITKSEGNLIYSIDDQPALDMYMRYLGSVLPSTDNQQEFFENLGNQYPIQIERDDREPLMCNPIGFDKEKKALICEINIQQGSRFRFSTPPDFDIVETVINKANELKNTVQTDADAVLIFSCAGRLASLGPMAQQENEGLAEVWNSPMAGFYSYGEFGRSVNGKHEFHSTTNSWVAIKEK
ncbi:MAG: FIST C-terminal domain-containing protein [Bacteroidota bacterium]|nr:FIST C-terminal domain-containing protein [Bacteroidota bacterium]